MAEVRCDNCGKTFRRKPSHVYSHIYCSRKCTYEHRRKVGIWKAKKCLNCGAPIRKGRTFCSSSCFYRYMWQTKWQHKKTNQYEPSRRRFATIILRVPQIGLTDFEMSLRHLVKEHNRSNGLAGQILVNIIGERRLKAEYE